METQLFRGMGSWLKKLIKQQIAGVDYATATAIPIENLNIKRNAVLLAKTLKYIRLGIFIIPTFFLKSFLRPHIYFQGQLKRE